MTIEELTAAEEQLMAQVLSVEGSMDEKHAELDARGVYQAYEDVHREYVELGEQGEIEALKRALFLQWYCMTEPSCFTGVRSVDQAAEHKVLRMLDELAASDSLDDELRWMLPFYDSVNDWYFRDRTNIPALRRWLDQNGSTRFPEDESRSVQLRARGQMSHYWYRPSLDKKGAV